MPPWSRPWARRRSAATYLGPPDGAEGGGATPDKLAGVCSGLSVLRKSDLPLLGQNDAMSKTLGKAGATGRTKLRSGSRFAAEAPCRRIGRPRPRRRRAALRSSGCICRPRHSRASTPSTARDISRIRASETGLSTTTTSSGLLRRRAPGPRVHLRGHPDAVTVTRSWIGSRRSSRPSGACPRTLSPPARPPSTSPRSDAMGRHWWGCPRSGQRPVEIGHRLPGLRRASRSPGCR